MIDYTFTNSVACVTKSDLNLPIVSLKFIFIFPAFNFTDVNMCDSMFFLNQRLIGGNRDHVLLMTC